MTGIQLNVDPEALGPLIRQIVTETLAAVEADRAKLTPNRLAYTESEAAGLLGLRPHVLRDIRLAGRISSSRGPGRRILYQPSDLLAYLARGRVEANPNDDESMAAVVGRLKDRFGTNGQLRGKRVNARD
jgi:Helix-turn-helix domain